MVQNLKWNVYLESDSDTHPKEKNKLVHIWTGEQHYLGKFVGSWFRTTEGRMITIVKPIFWQYVDELPNKVVVKYNFICMQPFSSCKYNKNDICMLDIEKELDCPFRKRKAEYFAFNE